MFRVKDHGKTPSARQSAPWGALLLTVILSLMAWASAPAQQQTVNVTNKSSEVVFQLDFYGQGQGSTGNFSQAQINAITEAAQYWVDILKPYGPMPSQLDANGNAVLDANGAPVHQPVVFTIYYDQNIVGNANAGANGYIQSDKDGLNVSLAEALMVDEVYVAPVGGGHATINVGSGWNAVSGNQSQSGRVQNDLTPVLVHELGHALGIASSATYAVDPVTWEVDFLFPDTISRYDSRLRDNNGNSPLTKPGTTGGKIIGYDATGTNADTIFDLGDPDVSLAEFLANPVSPSHVTFAGKNTLELWYGKDYDKLTAEQLNIGVPIQGYTYGLGWDYPYPWQWYYNPGGTLSHINTTNSLMSWQAYRNYPGFIEIELAMMQDLGYKVERRSFFGRSFYVDGDGKTVIYNDDPFWNWNGTGYEVGVPNTTVYGIGAHLFAKNLNVVQRGIIRADGAGAAGVRIDGSNNTLTIDRGVTVTADGVNGIGILAAYGKDHTITLQPGSLVQATGSGGIGVSFDFGASLFGNQRGSYYYGVLTDETGGNMVGVGYLPELYGSLVNDFNVSGTIIGTKSGQTATYRTPINSYRDDDGGLWAEIGLSQDEIDYWRDSEDPRVLEDVDDPRNYSWLEPWVITTVSRPFTWGAAIYINESYDSLGRPQNDGAIVDRINIMQGASIDGDILSRRAPVVLADGQPPLPTDQITTITFGYKAGADGAATNQADEDFYFAFKDNINYFRYELQPNILVHLGNGEYVTVSPAPDGPLGDDQFWRFTTWDEFFWDQDDLTIVRPGDGYVYADVVTEGSSTTNLHFVGGTTEFQGSTAYVNSVRIDAGATLMLTPEVQPVNSVITIDNVAYNVSRLSDVLKIPEIHIDADSPYDSNPGGIPRNFPDSRIYPLATTQVHPNPPVMVNAGRITGDGAFYFGQRRYSWDESMQALYGRIGVGSIYWDGTLRNEGTIAPGNNDGVGDGIILIQGDLTFAQNSVYEVTISGVKETRYHSGVLADGKYVDQFGQIYDPTIGQFRGANTTAFQGTGNDLIVVANNTTMDGTLKVTVASDAVFANETTVHTIIQSGTFTPGSNFKNVEYDQGFLYISNAFLNPYNLHEAQITVVRELDYFGKKGKTSNEIAVATAIDNSIYQSPDIAFSLGNRDYLATDVLDMFNQMGAHIRANSALMNLWNPAETLFNRIGYGNGQMETGHRGRVDWNRISGKTSRMLGQHPTRTHRTGSLWVDAMHTSFTAEADYDWNSGNYRFSRTGAMVGAEMNLTRYASLGAVMGFNVGNTRQAGDKVDSNDYTLGAYFVCAPLNEFEFKAYIGLGFQDYKMERSIYNAAIMDSNPYLTLGGPARYKSDFVGNTFNASFELARPLELHKQFILRPTLGVDTQYLWQNGGTENAIQGTGAYALSFQKMTYYRSLFRAGFSSETSGPRGGIRMRAFYVTQFAGENYPLSKARFASGGQTFDVRGVDLGGEFLNLGVGANIWLDGEKTASLFFDYDSEIYGTKKKSLSHTIQFGYLQNF